MKSRAYEEAPADLDTGIRPLVSQLQQLLQRFRYLPAWQRDTRAHYKPTRDRSQYPLRQND